MHIKNLQTFTKGWIIGNFDPSILKTTEFEVAVKKYRAGEKEEAHYHLEATEYTVIISGVASMNGVLLSENDVITVEPSESICFEAITDVHTVVIKTPSVIGDKYLTK